MSKDELLAALEAARVIALSDPENAHEQADRVLIEYIADEQIATAFDWIRKWYA